MVKISFISLFSLLIGFISSFSTNINATIIHSERSLYRNIIVEDKAQLRCLKFNVKHRKSNQSCFNKSNPQKLVFNYTKLLFSSLLLVDQPKRILIIGLGGGTMSNTLHQLFPDVAIDNVEIDPAVIAVARRYFSFIENDTIHSQVQDGRIFVKRAILKKQKYDWIILDAFNGDYIPEHLMTKEFLEEVKGLLSAKGVLASNTFSVSDLYAHESATYHAVFGDFYNVRNTANTNRIILTQPEGLSTPEKMALRAEALEDKLSPFGINIHDILKSITSTEQLQDWPDDTRLLTDQYSPANLLNEK
ncbi:MAG: fused MFS/spermidine synthase [Alteromonadaceae bacterium]|nr:fused MFS/spermidine synthase [Alteromonadaceae bacterium]